MGASSGLLFGMWVALLIATPLPGADLAGEFLAAYGEDPADVVREPRTAPDSGGITELAIQRTPCFGACPVYSFRVGADGAFQLDCTRFAEPAGTRTGTIDPAAFTQAAWKIAQGRFADLHASYRIGATDHPGLYVKVVKDGKAKIVYSYGGAGPLELQAIASQIDALAKLAGLVTNNN